MPETGSFEWIWEKMLATMEASGTNIDHVNALREKVGAITTALQGFRAKRRELGDSGRYSLQGLREAEQMEAAKVIGEVKRLMDTSHLLANINSHKEKLAASTKADPMTQLLSYMRQAEIRAELQADGISPADPVRADLAYRSALEAGDHDVMQALEQWPLRPAVSAQLMAQGQQQRLFQADPVAAKRLQDLEAFKDAMVQATHDALLELPQTAADPLPAMAGAPQSEA